MTLFDISIIANKLKLRILYHVNNIVLGHLPNNIISNNVRSVIGSYKNLEQNISDFKRIRNNIIEKYAFPNDIPIYFRREKAFDERHIFYLKRVNLSISTGLIWTDSNKILQESIGSLNRMLHWNDVRAYISLPKKKLEVSEDLFYYFLPSTGFYHFIIEELPAMLYAYREHGEQLRIILNRQSSNEYCKDLLKILLGDLYKDRIIEVDSNLYLDRLVMVQKEVDSGFVFSEDIQLLNDYLTLNLPSVECKSIYISRRKAAIRKMANEFELEKALEARGYLVVYLEELEMSQQISLIKNAENIIAPHGAGLSHLIWGNQKKQVVEIFPSSKINDCFARIAILKKCDYHPAICANKENKEYIPIDDILNILEKKSLSQVL